MNPAADSVLTGSGRNVEMQAGLPRRILRSPLTIMLVGLVLRLAIMTAEHTYTIKPGQENYSLGWETGKIAYSVATGQGFSSPFQGHTGPTAWVAPLYPYLVAGVFRIFGIYSQPSIWMLLAINSVFSALTCLTLYFIAKQTLGTTTALWSAWLWAVLPYSMYWAIRWVWETSLSALLLSATFLLVLRLQNSDSLTRWSLFGFTWGLIALSNPSLLSLLPFMLAWVCYARFRERRKWILAAGVAVFVFALSMAPWLIRNFEVFGKLVFIRSNFGYELRLGNYEGADGLWAWQRHPSQDASEFNEYARLGELAFVRERGREAVRLIGSHPAAFVWLSLKRAFYFWFGTPRSSRIPGLSLSRYVVFLLSTVFGFGGLCLMIKQRKQGVFLYAILMLVYPVVYYITFAHPRYRHPIEPEMMILAVYFIYSLISRKQQFARPS